MIDFKHQYIIPTDDKSTKNHFPILVQLGVLSLVMMGLFSGLLFIGKDSDSISTTNTNPTPISETATLPVVPQKINDISLRASAAYVWDVQSQRALYTKNSNTELPLASITKLMTALLAYELIEQNSMTTVSSDAIRQEGSSGLSVGERLMIEDLAELALVSSSNDAAYALAASVGELLGTNDPASQFIQGMNIRAEELGLESLNFKSTTGLDLSLTVPGATGSAKDISFLMEYIITEYPEILVPTQQTATRIYNTTGAYHDIENTNDAINQIPNLIGSKTGFTDLAGGNLTIAFDAGLNRPIIITVLGSTRDDRFTDVLKLVEAVQQSIGVSN